MYGRRVGERTLTFGVSGMLWRSALVMFDRETNTLWSHFTGEALRGPLAEDVARLRNLASVPKVRWGAWRERNPDTQVLVVGGETFKPQDVYADYHASQKTGVTPVEFQDTRLPPKALVVGCLPRLGAAAAVPHAAFPEVGTWVAPDGSWMLFRDPSTHVTAGWAAESERGPVAFAPGWNPGLRPNDLAEGTWDLERGVALDGPRAGDRLRAIPQLNVYWFAWADYHPSTELVLPPA